MLNIDDVAARLRVHRASAGAAGMGRASATLRGKACLLHCPPACDCRRSFDSLKRDVTTVL